ncbi:ubiquitin-conjugating enzyme E2 U isoform X3 [Leptonychotes weddellii]|uniref:Ubiquitin-conjugating enzyme E2 U n=1 Tax=Leptonychotes weddellii TaxID=9713 RepID=A0A7F8RD28_LEPWE|nr:ubiquitin-conjugating enzyme E2 U isoform X3 [Leptonychotes weddellii]
MHCRTDFLLERDFQELKENNFKGITAFPVSEDLMEWGADIEGLQNTFWHGLFFQLKINFTSQYNFVPPVVKFLTIPFHPNVDPNTGRACIDILDDPDKWNTSYTLSSVLLTLQVMLSNPVLENPVNLEAAQMLIKDESLYKQEVRRLLNQPTQLLEDPNFVVEYYKWKKAELKHPKEWNLKYAASMARLARESRRPSKVNYPTERFHLCPTPIQNFADSQTEMDIVMKTGRTKERWRSVALPDDDNANESWEEEAEDLVAWTNTLDIDVLEDSA